MNQKEKIKLKQQLKETCIRLLEQRIQTASEAMQSAQASANAAEKSSAGDKYETARAMGQFDRDMNAKQLEEAKKELAWLQPIDALKLHNQVEIGAVVVCRENMFFVAVGLGTISIDGRKIGVLSPKAPLVAMMNKKKARDHFTFNGILFEITEIF